METLLILIAVLVGGIVFFVVLEEIASRFLYLSDVALVRKVLRGQRCVALAEYHRKAAFDCRLPKIGELWELIEYNETVCVEEIKTPAAGGLVIVFFQYLSGVIKGHSGSWAIDNFLRRARRKPQPEEAPQ